MITCERETDRVNEREEKRQNYLVDSFYAAFACFIHSTSFSYSSHRAPHYNIFKRKMMKGRGKNIQQQESIDEEELQEREQ